MNRLDVTLLKRQLEIVAKVCDNKLLFIDELEDLGGLETFIGMLIEELETEGVSVLMPEE